MKKESISPAFEIAKNCTLGYADCYHYILMAKHLGVDVDLAIEAAIESANRGHKIGYLMIALARMSSGLPFDWYISDNTKSDEDILPKSTSIQSQLAHDLEQKCRDFVNNKVINPPSNS